MAKRNFRYEHKKPKLVDENIPAFSLGDFSATELPNEYKGLSEEEVLVKVKAELANNKELHDKSLEELQEKLLQSDPLHVLSLASLAGLSRNRVDLSEIEKDSIITVAESELLQAIILRSPRQDFHNESVTSIDYYNICNLIRNLITSSQKIRSFNLYLSDLTDNENKSRNLIEQVRIITQTVRNWGYPQHILSITKELFSPLDNQLEKQLGFTFTGLIEMCQNILKLNTDRLNKIRKSLSPALKTSTVVNAKKKFLNSFPDKEFDVNAYLKNIPNPSNVKEFRQFLITLVDPMFQQQYFFSLRDFIEAYPKPIDQKVISWVLDRWSAKFGQFADSTIEILFLNNPVWEKPIIELDQDLYFWSNLELFFSFCTELMESLIKDNPKLWEKYSNRRGNFLEERLLKAFKGYFPNTQIFTGSMWKGANSSDVYENDMIVIINSTAIVVEAKAARITAPARQGYSERLKKHFKDLIFAPSVQARRFTTRLQEEPKIHQFKTKRGVINNIDCSKVTNYINLSVTLDTLGTLSTRVVDLVKAGLVESESDQSLNISLAHLEIIFEILTSPSQKLHYLTRRQELEHNTAYTGDELDLLAGYLNTGFSFNDLEFDENNNFVFWNDSRLLDNYFLNQWHNKAGIKPHRSMSKWWQDIIAKLEEKNVDNWPALSSLLLNVNYEQQQILQKSTDKLKEQAFAIKHSEEYIERVVLFDGPKQRRFAILILVYKNLTQQARSKWINIAISQVKDEEENVQRVLTIGIDVNELSYPYKIIAAV